MNRQKIVQVLHSLEVGGAEKMAVSLASSLQDRFDFIYFCLDRGGPLSEQLEAMGVPSVIDQRSGALDLGLASRLRSVVKSHGASLIHAHQYTPFFYSLLSRLGRSSPPILFTEHGRFHPDSRDARRVVVNRLLMRSGDLVAGVGDSVATAVNENEGIPARRIETVYNGVALDQFLTPEPCRTEARSQLDIAYDEFVVLMVARLDPIKDHMSALIAIEKLSNRLDRVRLVIVGDGGYRQEIEQAVSSRGLERVVHMAGERQDVDVFMKAADVLLLTSVSEGIPLVLIEGMASGLPIVATAVGGVPEVVTDGLDGRLVPVGDPEAIAASLFELASDEDARARLGDRGRSNAIHRFSVQTMADAYAVLYDRLGRP